MLTKNDRRRYELSRRWELEGVPALEITRRLRKHGLIPGGNVAALRGRGPPLPARFVGDIVQAGLDAPAGAVAVARALGGDAISTLRGHPTFRRSAPLVSGMKEAYKEDFRHPLRHPGNFALDLLPIGAGAGITAIKVPAHLREARVFTHELREAAREGGGYRQLQAEMRQGVRERRREHHAQRRETPRPPGPSPLKRLVNVHVKGLKAISPYHKAKRTEARIFGSENDRPSRSRPLVRLAAASALGKAYVNLGRADQRRSRLKAYPR